MKLAIISDIHGNLSALKAVLVDVANQGVDQTVNLGDILSGPLQPAETADLLMALDLVTIRGNHERQVLALLSSPTINLDATTTDGFTATQLRPAHIEWLKSLPSTWALDDEVLLCHGTPDSDLLYWLETVVPGYVPQQGNCGLRAATAQEIAERLGDVRASLVLCGHTHVPRAVRSGRTLIVNPGSVGLQAYDDVHPFPHIIETGTPHARYAVIQSSTSGWQVDLRTVPYDHQGQAEVARLRGRNGWAHALSTGRVI